jgi:serine phosphatase RsbU (regulator of sigma subunit)
METRPKILLVDDEPFNLDYLAQELEDLEVRILTAANGREALEAVTQNSPDMIFLDIMMPVMDGFEVLRRLKADSQWNGIPVVIISASDDMPNVVKGIEMGAEDFLPKPFDPVLLHARLNAGLEKKRLRDIERRYLQALERELEIGREIQADFLPGDIPQPEGWEIGAFFRAAREVAGDFYDVFELENGHLALLLGDVTDKGVGAALFMALFRSLLRAALMRETLAGCDPPGADKGPQTRLKETVSLVNNYICQVHKSAMFATLFFGIMDTQSGELVYINAGQDNPYLLREDAIHAKLEPTGPVVGVIDGADFRTRSLTLEPGDALVLYSDGVPDALDRAGERFDQSRWQALLVGPMPSSCRLVDHLTKGVMDFIGEAPQYDDISLLTVRREG